MSKYSHQFKLRVVLKYLTESKSLADIARKYGIASKENVHKWLLHYRTYGPDGLAPRQPSVDYEGSLR